MNRYIKLDERNVIVSFRNGTEIVEGEIQSDTGELGQIMQEDGSFITPVTTSIETQPTMEDKINYLYYKGLGVI